MVVQQLMSASPVWCRPEDDVQSVATEMRTNNIGFVVVLRSADERQLVGVVTDRDVCLKVVAAGYDPRFTRVDEIMTHGGLSCKTRASIEHAFFRMQTGQVRRLPVLDAQEKVVGIISLDDIIRSGQIPPEALAKGLCRLFEGSRRTPGGKKVTTGTQARHHHHSA